jgi:hypothetical protein
MIKNPPHYARYKIEPVTFIMENELPFHTGNIVKYAVRAGHKMYDMMGPVDSEIADLEKVIQYCRLRIDQLSGNEVP